MLIVPVEWYRRTHGIDAAMALANNPSPPSQPEGLYWMKGESYQSLGQIIHFMTVSPECDRFSLPAVSRRQRAVRESGFVCIGLFWKPPRHSWCKSLYRVGRSPEACSLRCSREILSKPNFKCVSLLHMSTRITSGNYRNKEK